jgi:hypothetical protein
MRQLERQQERTWASVKLDLRVRPMCGQAASPPPLLPSPLLPPPPLLLLAWGAADPGAGVLALLAGAEVEGGEGPSCRPRCGPSLGEAPPPCGAGLAGGSAAAPPAMVQAILALQRTCRQASVQRLRQWQRTAGQRACNGVCRRTHAFRLTSPVYVPIYTPTAPQDSSPLSANVWAGSHAALPNTAYSMPSPSAGSSAWTLLAHPQTLGSCRRPTCTDRTPGGTAAAAGARGMRAAGR